MKQEISAAVTKTAPPVAVTGTQWIFDLTLNQWVQIATLAYIVLQAFFLVRNEIRKRKK